MVAQFHLPKFSIFLIISLVSSLIPLSEAIQQASLPTFDQYVHLFNKSYDNAEYFQRQKFYNENLKFIKDSNCSAVGINVFTDWSAQQMNKLKGGFQSNIPIQTATQPYNIKSSGLTLTETKTPLSFDWRDQKAVTSIKNQKNCGACWSYSTTAFFESDLIINQNYTNQIDLSQQFLLKCDNRSLKCDGGFLFWAMQKVIENGGIPRQSQYPYNYSNLWIENGMCYETDIIRIDPKSRMVSYYEVQDTKFVEKMILRKPINVNLCSKDMQFYAPGSGSRTLSCLSGQTNRDHTVLLVGYTQTQWIIKNQWSTSWGVDGYGYISKESANDCCIGKQLFTTGTISESCKVNNCEICVEETSCFQCKQGFYVKYVNGSHVCEFCLRQNCAKCINFFGLCDTCIEGYSVTYPSYRCVEATIENCAFMYNGECSECHQGYVLNNDAKCVSETDPCYAFKCTKCREGSNGLCSICENGYSLNTATFQCGLTPVCAIENCSLCAIDNKNWCEVCSIEGQEFSQASLKCVPVCKIEGCQNCITQDDKKTVCNQCLTGYRLNAKTNICDKCSVKYCASCNQNPVSSCQTCFSGYFFNLESSQCEPCSYMEFCIECLPTLKQNGFKCTKCASGYTLSSDSLTCLKCLGGCVTCNHSSLTQCSVGCGLLNYVTSTGSCQLCPQNCYECQDNNVCTKCFQGYRIEKGMCYPDCKEGVSCAQCLITSEDSVCLKCADGYQLVNKTCALDVGYSCFEQNAQSSQNCSSCPLNYYLKYSLERKICSKCTVNDSNCMSCSSVSPNKCNKCIDSFYLNKNTFTCLKCSDLAPNCLTCLDPNRCTKCNDGFYILSITSNDQASGICQPCSPSCLTCRYDSSYCLTCKDGYTLSTNRQCLRMMGVKFTFVLDALYDVLNQLLIELYDILKTIWSLDSRKFIEIVSLASGSIEVVGNLHMPQNETDQNLFLQKIRSVLISQLSIASYNVLSVRAELISKSDALKLTEIDQFPMGMLIGVSVGAGVFFICLVILIVIGIRKFILNNQGEETKKSKGEKKQKGKLEKEQSGVSTQPSSEKKSKRSKSKGESQKEAKSGTKQADQTSKYIKDEIQHGKNIGYPNMGVKV